VVQYNFFQGEIAPRSVMYRAGCEPRVHHQSLCPFVAVGGDGALIIPLQSSGLLIYLHVALVLFPAKISAEDNAAARRQLIVKYRLVIVTLGGRVRRYDWLFIGNFHIKPLVTA
jgi:hypothetical protein